MSKLDDIFGRLNKGEISDSRAFKEYQNAGGDGNFKDFMQTAVDNGWVTKVGQTVEGFINNRYGSSTELDGGVDYVQPQPQYEPKPQGLSTGAIVGIGVGVLAIVGTIIYVSKNK
jgi:hypothetical protein